MKWQKYPLHSSGYIKTISLGFSATVNNFTVLTIPCPYVLLVTINLKIFFKNRLDLIPFIGTLDGVFKPEI